MSECIGGTFLLGSGGWGMGRGMGGATLHFMWPLGFQVPGDDNGSQQKPSQSQIRQQKASLSSPSKQNQYSILFSCKMYPRRRNTRVKGVLSEHAHTRPPAHIHNEAVSLSHTHTHTRSQSHARMYTMYNHTDPGFPSSLLAGCSPSEVWGKARGRTRGTVSGRKPAEP